MSCCQSNHTAAKAVLLIGFLLFAALFVAALPEIQRYWRIRTM